MGQRFAIGSLSDVAALARIREALAEKISDIGVMGANRHWLRYFETAGPNSESSSGIFFREREAIRYTGRLLRELLCAQSLAGAGNLEQALLKWMMPAHVDILISALAAGNLLVWIPVTVPEHECAVCLVLLRNTRNTVQIHDFDCNRTS